MYLAVSCAGPTVIKPASERNYFPPLERESREVPRLSEILCVYDMEFLPPFPACLLTLWESFPGCPVGYVHPLPNSATSNPSLHTCESSPALIKFKVTWATPPPPATDRKNYPISSGHYFQIRLNAISRSQGEGTSDLRNPSKGGFSWTRDIPQIFTT